MIITNSKMTMEKEFTCVVCEKRFVNFFRDRRMDDDTCFLCAHKFRKWLYEELKDIVL